MSMLISASATVAKMRAAAPGSSGTPTIVIFASLRSCATPVMSACSTGSSSIDPVTMVPVLFEYDERTWIGDAGPARVLDAAQVQHLGAAGGQLQHLLVGDLLDVTGVRHDPRVGA